MFIVGPTSDSVGFEYVASHGACVRRAAAFILSWPSLALLLLHMIELKQRNSCICFLLQNPTSGVRAETLLHLRVNNVRRVLVQLVN